MRETAVLLLALLMLAPGCSRRNRDVGVEPAPFAWTTLQGDARRAGTENKAVPTDPEVAWSIDVGRGLRSEPLVDRGVLLIAGSNRLIAAYDADNGDRFWEQRLNASVSGGILWRNDTLWVATESLTGEVSARRLNKGGLYWERDVGPARVPPLLVGGTLYLATDDGALTALHAPTGERRWRTRLSGVAAGTPVLHGDRVVAIHDTVYVVEPDEGIVEERIALPAGASAMPALLDDLLVIPLHGGVLAAVDLDLGEVRWQTPVGGTVVAAPVISEDGTAYALTTSGEVWRVLPGERRAGRIAALGGAARGSLTLVRDGLLVGRLDGFLFLLSRDGDVVWERDLGGSIVAPVAVSDGAIYVPLLDGKLSKLE